MNTNDYNIYRNDTYFFENEELDVLLNKSIYMIIHNSTKLIERNNLYNSNLTRFFGT